MDPNACYERWKSALKEWAFGKRGLMSLGVQAQKEAREGAMNEAAEAAENLRNWLSRGGFQPEWSAQEKAAFMKWRAPKGYPRP